MDERNPLTSAVPRVECANCQILTAEVERLEVILAEAIFQIDHCPTLRHNKTCHLEDGNCQECWSKFLLDNYHAKLAEESALGIAADADIHAVDARLTAELAERCKDEPATPTALIESRNAQYGDPVEMMGRIATAWSEYLGALIWDQHVAEMMAELKRVRLEYQINNGVDHTDSLRDREAYLEIARRCREPKR